MLFDLEVWVEEIKCARKCIFSKPTSDYKAIVQHIVSPLIQHLWLKTLLTAH